MVKKYNTYLKESHLDIDPFEEEDWDDDNIFNVGDLIICLDDNVYGITKGNIYKVLEVDKYNNPRIMLDKAAKSSSESGYYFKYRFKKTKINESKKVKMVNEDYEYGPFKLGQEVRINDDSEFRVQAYDYGGDGTGFIDEIYKPSEYGFCYWVKWKNGRRRNYRPEDLIQSNMKKIKRPDIDPLGEDDWGYEIIENVENSYDIISFDFFEACEELGFSSVVDMLIYLLDNSSESFYNKHQIKKISKISINSEYWALCGDELGIEIELSSGDVCRYSYGFIKKQKFSMNLYFRNVLKDKKYDEFLITHSKKIVKRPDIDPLGEEDWEE